MKKNFKKTFEIKNDLSIDEYLEFERRVFKFLSKIKKQAVSNDLKKYHKGNFLCQESLKKK